MVSLAPLPPLRPSLPSSSSSSSSSSKFKAETLEEENAPGTPAAARGVAVKYPVIFESGRGPDFAAAEAAVERAALNAGFSSAALGRDGGVGPVRGRFKVEHASAKVFGVEVAFSESDRMAGSSGGDAAVGTRLRLASGPTPLIFGPRMKALRRVIKKHPIQTILNTIC
jgi:hypothetical protein